MLYTFITSTPDSAWRLLRAKLAPRRLNRSEWTITRTGPADGRLLTFWRFCPFCPREHGLGK